MDDEVVTTWITAAELMDGAARSGDPAPNPLVASPFPATLEILDMDAIAAERFGTIKADLEGRGRRLADADLRIAAISLAHDGVLVAGNRRHDDRVPGLRIENWLRDGE